MLWTTRRAPRGATVSRHDSAGRGERWDAATLRCLQWLASGLPPVDRGVTVDAVRQNLRDGCGVTATEAQVAGWLSR